MVWAPAQKAGDTDPLISEAKAKLAAFSYGKGLGSTDEYTAAFGAALRTYGQNIHAQVVKGTRKAPDVNVTGVFDWAIKTQLGVLAPPAPPPVWTPRIPTYVFRGTGGIPGLDPVSRVCQRLGGLVEEINTPWAATMGGIPVGATGGVGDPSMWSAVQAGLVAAQNDFLGRRTVNPGVKVCVIGYSAGAILAALFKQWLLDNFPQNYVASASFGDPSRPNGGGFYGRPAPSGNGIADFELGDVHDYRHAWLTHEKDMYAQIPGGVVGDIMEDIYAEVTQFAFTDIMQVALRMLSAVPKIADKAGIPLPEVFGALAGGIPGLFSLAVVKLFAALPGLIPSSTPAEQLTGTAAAAKAAMLGLEFLFAGTAPHIRYEFDEAWPGGPTFVDFAAMHLSDWIHRLPH